jgi:hypothetical protein
VWYAKALDFDAIIVEDFFDQVYEDLEPFWGLQPLDMRYAAAEWDHAFSVRKGKVADIRQDRHRARTWRDMLRKLSRDLPDLDIVTNPLDESRVIASWDAVNTAMAKAFTGRKSMMALQAERIAQQFSSLPEHVDLRPPPTWTTGGDVWQTFRAGCPAKIDYESARDENKNFVGNWTASKDICLNPKLGELHGALIEPATFVIYKDLVPIFSTAKLRTNNDILLPPPSYYAEDSLFSVKTWLGDASTRFPWSKKTNGLVWRGKATGGTTRVNTWQQFHRHRFVATLNASNVETNVAITSSQAGSSPSLLGKDQSTISNWLSKTANVAFTGLFCDGERETEPVCRALSSHYELAPEIKMDEQYRWKYLPDVDGNSLSGRFRAFLRSNSAPIKATIFKEWHDSRLTPWVHFIPVDMTFHDLWEVMAYFLGFGTKPGHDQQGRNIALAGREWAERVLRKEDMLLYMHRVLLEYARICDEQRDHLGYVADLAG